jgi:hypothetical protein
VNKKGGKILMWLLSWAILALVVIYSPIGSPDLYTGNKYIVYNQGVNFSGGIANAPKVHNYTDQYPSTDLGIPTYTPEQKKYTVSSASGSSKVNKETNYSVSPAMTGRTGTNASGSGGVSGLATFGSGGSSQKNSIDPTTGVGTLTLSSDLTTIQNPTATTRQGANADAALGGTDPGGDPTGPPIPVGDGFWILLFMAGVYAFVKRFIRPATI